MDKSPLMNKRLLDLQLHQTDAMLEPWQQLRQFARPKLGWVSAIRHSLGMSATALARRLGMTHSGVLNLEKAEVADAISLATLRKLAAAMDCEVHYALVPRVSLKQTRRDRALQVAKERLKPVQQSMSLEDQSLDSKETKVQLELLAEELLKGSGRELW
jgi:predicted DNA-binding mobile mystery protein A